MIERAALIDDPELTCLLCGNPLRVDHDWAKQLRLTDNRMSCCCNRQLTPGQVAVFMSKARKAREGGRA